ncbi:MAG: 4Fe-4S binding protein [bacterium]
MVPMINHEQCVGCGTCIVICPCEVFEVNYEKSEVVRPDSCTGCGECIENCPNEAISLS